MGGRRPARVAESVLSIVPAGFDAYLRVLHPAARDGLPVRWSEIATLKARRLDEQTSFDVLIDSRDPHNFAPEPGVFDEPPWVGSLPHDLADTFVRVLREHTATPAACWFAVWEGWGDIRRDVQSGPIFTVPNRAYHLLAGPITAATESVGRFDWQSVSLWWPDDRAWCVATEIDFNFTYVGCDAACRDELLAAPDLEVLVADPMRRWRPEVG